MTEALRVFAENIAADCAKTVEWDEEVEIVLSAFVREIDHRWIEYVKINPSASPSDLLHIYAKIKRDFGLDQEER